MPLYRFKVSDSAGDTLEQLVEGDSQADAVRRLQSRGLTPLRFLGTGSAANAAAANIRFNLRRRFDIIDFTDQLVPLLDAKIPLERALGILGDSTKDAYAASVIAELRKGLHEGRRLSQMLRDRRHLFPEIYASLVEAGEESGALPQIMGDLRRFLNERRELNAYVVSASIYPAIVFSVSLVVLGILLGVMVPKFAEVLLAAGTEPTFSTRILIVLSNLVRGYWWVVPLALLGGLFFFRHLRGNASTKASIDSFLLRAPFIRRIVLYSNLARMSRTMSILMRSGVHILDTVAISARVLQNVVLRDGLAAISSELRRGERLASALARIEELPPLMLRMVAVGEETGNVGEMLERVAERFEGDLKKTVARALSMLEPAIIVLLGVVVGLIVVTMFLAIMDMQSTI